MKSQLKITRFKELANKEISLPKAIISGKNGAGKTSIMEAFYFLVDGKKADGLSVGGEIYPQSAKSKIELFAEVELEFDGIKFTRRCNGAEKRAKGSAEVELVRSITTQLFIEEFGKREIVTQRAWSDEISKYFPENYRYFTNPNYLSEQKQSDVKDFVFGLLGLSEFDTLNKDVAKSKVSETKKEIEKLDNQLSVHEVVIEPELVVDFAEKYDAKIKDLRAKVNIPQLSNAESLHNSEIQKQIASVESEVAKTKEIKSLLDFPALQKKSLIALRDASLLESEIEKMKLKEFDETANNRKIADAESLNARKKDIENKIENYDKIKEGLNCTICPICTDLFCEKRSVDIDSLEGLREENESIDFVNVENLETQFDLQKVEFIENRDNQIAGLEVDLKKINSINSETKEQNDTITAENQKLVIAHNLKVEEIKERNAKIATNNESVLNENRGIVSKFQTTQNARITELTAKIKYPQKVDNSEIENKIEEIETLKSENKTEFLAYVELKAVFDHAKREIGRLSAERTAFFEQLVNDEQSFIIEKQKERKYYTEIENTINSELSDFGIEFKLYKKLISTDDYRAEFKIVLNRRMFNSNGEGFIQKVNLCLFFQSRKNIVLPILCDETTILDEGNIDNLAKTFDKNGNVVIFEKTSKSLNILNF